MLEFDPHTELMATLKGAVDSDNEPLFADVFDDEAQELRRAKKPYAMVLYASGNFEYKARRYLKITSRVGIIIISPNGYTDADMTRTRNDMIKHILAQDQRLVWEPKQWNRYRYDTDGGQQIAEAITMEYVQDALHYQ